MAQVEQELAKVQDIKPQLEQLAKSQEILKDEKEKLELANQQQEEKSRVLEEKLTVVEQTKDQVDFIFIEIIYCQLCCRLICFIKLKFRLVIRGQFVALPSVLLVKIPNTKLKY